MATRVRMSSSRSRLSVQTGCAPRGLERANRHVSSRPDPAARIPAFAYSDSRAAPPRSRSRVRGRSSGSRRNHRHERTTAARCRCRRVRAHQRRMLVLAPLVQAEQDGAVGVEYLTEVGVTRWRLRLAEQRLVPADTRRHISHADDRPDAFHARNLTRTRATRDAPRPSGVSCAIDLRNADSGAIETASSRDRLHACFRSGEAEIGSTRLRDGAQSGERDAVSRVPSGGRARQSRRAWSVTPARDAAPVSSRAFDKPKGLSPQDR